MFKRVYHGGLVCARHLRYNVSAPVHNKPITVTIAVSLDNRFYRAMLCIRGTSHGPVSVCPSVCPSQVGVLPKRLNVGSRKQHDTIVQGL